MNNILLITVSVICGLFPATTAHDRPIIGIMVQEVSKVFELMYPNRFDSFIAASYVKWIESAGARVVPIWIGEEPLYYELIMSKINGILLPGGNIDKNDRGGYAESAGLVMKIATEMNLRNDFFPIFGVGVGMDLMLYYTNDNQDITANCLLDSIAAPLILSKKDSRHSALYNSSSDHIKKMMVTHPVAVLNARKCHIREIFERSRLAQQWIPFSYNHDKAGNTIVSAVEHDTLPFYGTLFHSETIGFEWVETTNSPHTLATIEVSQFFANYFVNEARKNAHTFSSKQEELDHVIENFAPLLTAKDGSNYFQAYLFSSRVNKEM